MNLANSLMIIDRAIEQLDRLARIDVRNRWRYYTEDYHIKVEYTKYDFCQDIEDLKWSEVQLNEKGYIIFPAGEKVIWLRQNVTIPKTLSGYPLSGLSLRLILTWWAKDARIYVNGRLVQEGDLFDSSARVLLTAKATPGETIAVVIRLVSPGHDIGALMRSICLYCRSSDLDPCFVADEIRVLRKYLTAFEPEKLEILAAELEKIEWEAVEDREKFDLSLNNLRDRLLALSETVKQSSINLVGHAHLDMAWLWTVAETLDVAERTFRSVLNLQQDFPNLTFCHTTPALYEWIEKNRPDLFTEIQKAVKTNTWEVLGGMWVEPEINLLSGESLVRQLLYGQKYIQEKFGQITKIGWLPDSFGFCASLPQILALADIKYFVTGKLHWNDTTKFPHGFFRWRSPDGSEVITLMSPPNLTGVMDTNPITMANYAVDWQLQTGIKDAFWLPGVGDHGGGPTRDMLEVYQRCSNSPFFPDLKFTRAIDYLEAIATRSDIPVWDEELYLELHRGCYTTKGDQKYFNRRCEGLLYQAELWASLASIISEGDDYPDRDLEYAWKKVLFNQFHDILPGTSIKEVFAEANRDWIEAERIANKILSESIEAIASRIIFPTPVRSDAIPIIVFNSLNWIVSQVVCLDRSDRDWDIYSLDGENLSTQVSHDNKLLFLAEDIPSIGYRVFWLSPKIDIDRNKINTLPSSENLACFDRFIFVSPTYGYKDTLPSSENLACFDRNIFQLDGYKDTLPSSSSENLACFDRFIFVSPTYGYKDTLPSSENKVVIDRNIFFQLDSHIDNLSSSENKVVIDRNIFQLDSHKDTLFDSENKVVIDRNKINTLPSENKVVIDRNIFQLDGYKDTLPSSENKVVIDRNKINTLPSENKVVIDRNIFLSKLDGYKDSVIEKENKVVIDRNIFVSKLDNHRDSLSWENKVVIDRNKINTLSDSENIASLDRNISSRVEEVENGFTIENEWLRVTIDSQTGDLKSIFDKVGDREILNGAGNQLQAFQDKGQYWDAWNIDPDYNKYPIVASQISSIEYLESGPIRFLVRVVRKLGQSDFIQDYILERNSPILKIATTVNWQETHVLVKAAFPLNMKCDRVFHEIPFAAISRPTTPETPAQQAKWEICVSRWLEFAATSLKEENCQDYGVSFLNDSKYGCDFSSDRVRISLLRSPVWPDPKADRGEHKFTYAVYPHSGDWRKADTVRRGYELNIPLFVTIGSGEKINNKICEELRAIESFFDLKADNLVLSAFKKAEDRSNTWIVRCYECHGEAAELVLNEDWEIVGDRTLDLLERPLQSDLVTNPSKLLVRPWKIVTFAVKRRKSEGLFEVSG